MTISIPSEIFYVIGGIVALYPSYRLVRVVGRYLCRCIGNEVYKAMQQPVKVLEPGERIYDTYNKVESIPFGRFFTDNEGTVYQKDEATYHVVVIHGGKRANAAKIGSLYVPDDDYDDCGRDYPYRYIQERSPFTIVPAE